MYSIAVRKFEFLFTGGKSCFHRVTDMSPMYARPFIFPKESLPKVLVLLAAF